jgi:hypothetical protein
MRGAIETLIFVVALSSCDGDPNRPADLGAPDLSPLPPAPAAVIDHSLFYSDAALLDGSEGPQLGKLLSIISPDGGTLFSTWMHRFATTAHSERAGPAQLADDFAASHGADPGAWDLSALPFKPTGIHNRIDLADLSAPEHGHCGELRVSFASTDPVYQPFHLLFLFRQPIGDGDLRGGVVTCEGTARRWLALSALDGLGFVLARDQLLREALTRDRFLMAETVEFTIAPWEWRQWVKVKDPSGALPFVLDNQPLFQTAEPSVLNAAGPLRDQFLGFVTQNAAALSTRSITIPQDFERDSTHVTQGVPRAILSLDGLDPSITNAYPSLRPQIELMGCPACHTTDADFVQTRPDRSISPFYEKELEARRTHLDALGRGDAIQAAFGPLQESPVLPP